MKLSPTVISIDLNTQLERAAKKCFPEAKIEPNFYFLAKSLYVKAFELRMFDKIKESDTHKVIHGLLGLAF